MGIIETIWYILRMIGLAALLSDAAAVISISMIRATIARLVRRTCGCLMFLVIGITLAVAGIALAVIP